MTSPTSRRETSGRFGWMVDALVLAVLLVVAIALRKPPLAPHSLWIDDAWVSLLWKVHTVADVRRISVASPGFTVLLKLWFRGVGFSSLRAQLPAFVFGVLGPPVVYLAARAWRLGRAAALLGAGLLLVSPVHMRYSARVKAFTLEALAAAVVLVIADRLLSDPSLPRRWYAFATAAVIATMLSAPLVMVCIPGFLAGFVAARRAGVRISRAALGATGGFAVFSVVWYVVAIHGAIDHNLVQYWANYYISHNSVGALLTSTGRGFSRLAHGFAPVPSLITLAALAASAAWIIRVRPDRAVLLLGPVVLAAAIAVLHRNPFGGGRTDIYLYSDLALALACGADALFTRVQPRVAFAATMVLIVGLAALDLPVPAYPKEDFRAMLTVVDANIRTNDAILLYPKARFAAALYTNWPFHLRGPVPGTSVTTPFDLDIDRPLTFVPADTMPVHFAATVRKATAASRRIWYVGTHGGPDYNYVSVLLRRDGYAIHLRRGFAPHYWLQLWTRPPRRPS